MQSDFVQLQQLVNRSECTVGDFQQFAPNISSRLDMAQRLVQVGIDVSRMGNEAAGVLANIMHSLLLSRMETRNHLLHQTHIEMPKAF